VTSDFSHVVGDVAYSRGKIHRTVALPDIVVRAFERHRTRQSERRLAAGGLWQPSDFTFTTAMGRPLEGTLVTRDLKQRAVDSRLSTGGRARGGRSGSRPAPTWKLFALPFSARPVCGENEARIDAPLTSFEAAFFLARPVDLQRRDAHGRQDTGLTVRQAAAVWDVSKSTAARRLREGAAPAHAS
jgi:hypothetical protein